ncbi:MAG: hypothetical protein R3E48_08495 [Burkholderiaceae bacterium]
MTTRTAPRKTTRRICAGLTALMISSQAAAAQIHSVQVGDIYTLWGLSANKRVQVREVNRARSTAKVADASGNVEWVSADRLMTPSEATRTDVGLGFVILGGAICLLTDACKGK